MQAQPYLFFNDRCEEAIEFYREALDAQVDAMMRFSDCPEPLPPGMVAPGREQKIMHASLRIGDTTVMASDSGCSDEQAKGYLGFSMSLSVPDEPSARRRFDALAQGGQVYMPLAPTFFSSAFGIVVDRFGIRWMVNVAR